VLIDWDIKDGTQACNALVIILFENGIGRPLWGLEEVIK